MFSSKRDEPLPSVEEIEKILDKVEIRDAITNEVVDVSAEAIDSLTKDELDKLARTYFYGQFE